MIPAAVDQMLGVECMGCHELLAHRWAENHIPEDLWNRACGEDPKANPCERSRDNVCALCGEWFVPA